MMVNKIASPLSIAFMLLIARPSQAQFFCSEPSIPYCINSSFTFDNELSFDQCRRSIEQYADDVGAYIECMEQEYVDAREQVLAELDDAIEKFNCQAEGNSFCF